MRRTVSYNEIVATVTKALFALGAPPGVDSENGKNIAWLQAHQLDGVEMLAREIQKFSRIDEWPMPKKEYTSEGLSLTSTLVSSLTLAQTGLDFVETGKTVSIKMCAAPLIFFAESARRASKSKSFEIILNSDNITVKGICKDGRATIDTGRALNFMTANITIKQTVLNRRASPNSTENIYEHSLYNGMLVNDAHWDLITQISKKCLVPNNKYSRAGAGAEVDDSN